MTDAKAPDAEAPTTTAPASGLIAASAAPAAPAAPQSPGHRMTTRRKGSISVGRCEKTAASRPRRDSEAGSRALAPASDDGTGDERTTDDDDASAPPHHDEAGTGSGASSPRPGRQPGGSSSDGPVRAARRPLEDLYGPYLAGSDRSLDDARSRLQTAIEQTRVLRRAMEDGAYGRFRCVLRPAPDSLRDVVDPILDDPAGARDRLLAEIARVDGEKAAERRTARENGYGPEELAYYGEGLHLVVLPEDTTGDEGQDHHGGKDGKGGGKGEGKEGGSGIDLSVYPDRSPRDPPPAGPSRAWDRASSRRSRRSSRGCGA
ncbi:hypothetical protein THAOC_05475 [Thalassiosira oceanica]|uniref:Uncharacterized protein n=1 Tax=Thalassiosira oceanica TaxID=159749 RepID=K0TMS5_THAOC|nr:hypothetical protein THAOC_05475 [Thalassiosira oceanica]|eukprot:EJK72942.1 hypothetical protein THAOC_05475 [Thalassiosira oceanica]